MIVDLQYEIRALAENGGIAGLGLDRGRARRPAAGESANKPRTAEASIPAVGGTGRELARLPRGIGEYQGVMDYAAVIGTKLGSAHIHILIQIHGNHEAAELIGPIGRDRELRRNGSD